ncbi:putative ABC transporter permease, partial [Clostridium oryzae]|uniref:putative ABC transporter permease n=1 Tax=Clostridium oryzae TaxID=1450648 RepID=UPI001116E35B
MKYYVIVFLFFSIYSFLGWVLETTSVSLEKGRFVNRGFLTGCFCPVYGFGAVIVIKVSSWLNIYVRNEFSFIIVDILVSIVLITALEYSTGIILNNIFNRKWWDYSNEFANINGYVCLRNSIIWGILAVLLVQFIHPIIYKVVLYAPNKVNN